MGSFPAVLLLCSLILEFYDATGCSMNKNSNNMTVAENRVKKRRINYLTERIRELNLSAEEVDRKIPADNGLLMSIESEINQANSLIEFYRGSGMLRDGKLNA
jgi:hypothetical protein